MTKFWFGAWGILADKPSHRGLFNPRNRYDPGDCESFSGEFILQVQPWQRVAFPGS